METLEPDFNYKKYSLEQLDNWINDVLNTEQITPQEIYDIVVKCVAESVEYHSRHMNKSVELLSLLKGNRPVVLETKKDGLYEEVKKTYDEMRDDGWEMTADGFWWKEPISNVKENP